MYKLFKICSPPYFPNRIDKISELGNFVKVGGVPHPSNTHPSYGPESGIIKMVKKMRMGHLQI